MLETKNFNLLDKNCTQEKIKFHIQHEESWLRWIAIEQVKLQATRSSHSEVSLRKGLLKICSKYTGEHPCRSVISIKLQSNFIEIALRHGCSSVNLLHIFRTPFLRNTSELLLLKQHYVPLYFLKEIVLTHSDRLFGRSNRDVFLENEGKIHKGGCARDFLVDLLVFSFSRWHLVISL